MSERCVGGQYGGGRGGVKWTGLGGGGGLEPGRDWYGVGCLKDSSADVYSPEQSSSRGGIQIDIESSRVCSIPKGVGPRG